MKIKYNTSKGNRYKKGSIKVKKLGKRLNIFDSLNCKGYWWHCQLEKWIKYEDWHGNGDISTNCHKIKNVKQLIRHIKKHSDYLPKGTKFILVSRFSDIKNIVGVL